MYLWLCVNKLVKNEGFERVRSVVWKKLHSKNGHKESPSPKESRKGEYLS
jgi:hypothetical protein